MMIKIIQIYTIKCQDIQASLISIYLTLVHVCKARFL